MYFEGFVGFLLRLFMVFDVCLKLFGFSFKVFQVFDGCLIICWFSLGFVWCLIYFYGFVGF